MWVEDGVTESGRKYEIREGVTGGGKRMWVIQWADGQIFKGTDSKPCSLNECRCVARYSV